MCTYSSISHLFHYDNAAAHPLGTSTSRSQSICRFRTSSFLNVSMARHRQHDVERASAPPTPAISITASAPNAMVLGVGHEVSPLVSLAIATAATALLGEGAIVFSASFSLRKQKRVQMNLKRVVRLLRVSLR